MWFVAHKSHLKTLAGGRCTSPVRPTASVTSLKTQRVVGWLSYRTAACRILWLGNEPLWDDVSDIQKISIHRQWWMLYGVMMMMMSFCWFVCAGVWVFGYFRWPNKAWAWMKGALSDAPFQASEPLEAWILKTDSTLSHHLSPSSWVFFSCKTCKTIETEASAGRCHRQPV